MSKEFVVRLKHNATDDRWTFTLDGVKPEEMAYYPQYVGGTDDWGYEQQGPWNESTDGFLSELLSSVTDEVLHIFKDEDSFYYENGQEVDAP